MKELVGALFTIIRSTERVRKSGDAALLSLLQRVAALEHPTPSSIATELGVHQSTITRQAQTLHGKGFIAIVGNPEDGRSCILKITTVGRKELARLNALGLARFEKFFAEWEVSEVRELKRLLNKLEQSKAEVKRRETAKPGISWRKTL